MGWGSGGELFSNIIVLIHDKLSDEEKEEVYPKLIDEFEMHDCDTLYESQGIDWYLDRILAMRHFGDYIERGYIKTEDKLNEELECLDNSPFTEDDIIYLREKLALFN